jgi:GT2 family glycosyltransferase
MKKVLLVQMVWDGLKYIPKSFDAMINQTYPNIEILAVINGNKDGGKEYIEKHYPQVKIIDPGENLRFVRGHNLVFSNLDADLVQLVNQDLILEPTYVEQMVKVFEDEKVGAANGKIYQYDFSTNQKSNKLDTTGVTISKTGRGRSRGQNEVDSGQFDNQKDLIAVDGAACMYSKQALESVKYLRPDGTYEYFDVDFEMYWEDVDLSWRMVNAGWKCKFVPEAIGYHGRSAGSSEGGYKKVWAFIKHHRNFPDWILQFNYKNHIFLLIKNSPKFFWQMFAREFFYQAYVLIIETRTLKILPTLFKQLPLMWKKRKYIEEHRKISTEEMEKLFS